MRKLILIPLILSCFALLGQDKITPESRFHAGMGLGFGNIAYQPIVQLNLSYNIKRVHIIYAQTMFTSNNAPSFFQGRIGYQVGNRLALIPYFGYSYKVYNVESGDYGGAFTSGSELLIALAPFRVFNPTLYIDVNRSHGYNLFALGIKGTL